MKKTFRFVLALDNITVATDKLEDALFNAGCSDALLNFKNKAAYLDFDRTAESIEAAIISAIRAVETSNVARVIGVEPSYLVTLAEIARRTHKSRQHIQMLANGERGNGTFPNPIFRLGDKSPLWRWKDVAAWLFDNRYLKDATVIESAAIIEDIHMVLEQKTASAKTIKHRSTIMDKLSHH